MWIKIKASSTALVLRPHEKHGPVRNCEGLLLGVTEAVKLHLGYKHLSQRKDTAAFPLLCAGWKSLARRCPRAHQEATVPRSVRDGATPLLTLCTQFCSSCDLQRHHGLSDLIFARAGTAPQASEISQQQIPGDRSSVRQLPHLPAAA